VDLTDTVAVTPVRKILLAMLLVSLTGSAFGAGTFASFNATTTNGGSTFATGSLVLSNKTTDKNNTVTTCLSTGGSNTDSNSNAVGCGVLFNTTVAKPGDTATMDLDLVGAGSLSATKLQAFASAACADTQNAVATYTGTGNACAQTQLTIQEYTSSTNRTGNTTTGGNCWYGSSSGVPTLTGSAITANPTTPTVITGSNNTLNVTVDGEAVVAAIGLGSYNSPAALAFATQTAIRAQGTATKAKQVQVGGAWSSTANTTGTITIASGKNSNSGSIAITGGNAMTPLGLSVTSNAGAAQGAACSFDAAHTLGGFAVSTTGFNASNMLDMGGLTATATRFFRISVKLPDFATNDVQGRRADITFGWRADQ
jgi:hypothetical protein